MGGVEVEPRTGAGGESTREGGQFKALMLRVAVSAGIAHAGFLVLFAWNGVYVLAAVNVLSVLSYVASIVLLRSGRSAVGLYIPIVEVIAHAVVATALIGWDTGFYQYVMLLIPVAMVRESQAHTEKAAIAGAGLVGYVVLDVLCRHRAAPLALPQQVIEGLYYVNLVTTLLILSFLAASYSQIVSQAQRSLRRAADTDSLTMLLNRRAALERIERAERQSARHGVDVSFLMIDIDHFKNVNDGFGHDVGDQVIRSVSLRITGAVRGDDVIARWGGEEFLVILPGADTATAAQTAERIRAGVEQRALVPAGSGRITVTVGTATMEAGETAYAAIARADHALLAGKRAGRNQVVQHETALRLEDGLVGGGAEAL